MLCAKYKSGQSADCLDLYFVHSIHTHRHLHPLTFMSFLVCCCMCWLCMHCLLLECYCATQEHVLKKCMIILRHDLKGTKGMNYFLFLFFVCAYM